MDTIEQARAALATMIAEAIDNAEPGARNVVVRCKPGAVPFRLALGGAVALRPVRDDEDATGAVEVRSQRYRAVGPDTRAEDVDRIVQGIASSTSEDWYGTEMTRGALDDMAEQFRSGVAYLPRHGSFFQSVEWDEVIGETFDAEVRRSDVANGREGSQGHVLDVLSRLYENDDVADKLLERLGRGQPIGQSIGGWFLEMRYTFDADGELDRILIEKVELDHLAVVRGPANPDSVGLGLLSRAWDDVANRDAPEPDVVVDVAPADAPVEATDTREAPPTTDAAPASPVDPTTAEETAVRNRATVADGGVVDAPVCPEHSHDESGQRAQEDNDMDAKQILDAINGLGTDLRSRLDALDERVAAVEAPAVTDDADDADDVPDQRTASAVAAEPDPELAALRAKIAEMEAREKAREEAAADLIGHRARTGDFGATGALATPYLPTGSHDSEVRAKKVLDGMIQLTRKDGRGARTLATVVERATDVLVVDIDKRAGMHDKVSRRAIQAAPDLLREICLAAEADGYIGNFRGWR